MSIWGATFMRLFVCLISSLDGSEAK